MDNKSAILATLAYFDLFHYPLTEREIYFFLSRHVPPAVFEHALGALLAEERVFAVDGFYSLHGDAGLVHRRRAGNALAARMLGTADRITGLLSRFPFVRAVGVSGSLSKQYADKDSDIDLFIITAPGRLWIARTLLHLLKKASFLLRRQDWFCMNYFIDETALAIPEQNLYTAIEIVTLLPLRGAKVFSSFRQANDWTDGYLPNSYGRIVHPGDDRPSLFRRALEKAFAGKFGDRLDHWLMTTTARRWRKKTIAGRRNNRGVLLTMDATPHTARPDPAAFQQKLLEAYALKVEELLRPVGTGRDAAMRPV